MCSVTSKVLLNIKSLFPHGAVVDLVLCLLFIFLIIYYNSYQVNRMDCGRIITSCKMLMDVPETRALVNDYFMEID